MGRSDPPAVCALPVVAESVTGAWPAAACSSARVVEMMTVTGSPLSWPRSPQASTARQAASRASWVR